MSCKSVYSLGLGILALGILAFTVSAVDGPEELEAGEGDQQIQLAQASGTDIEFNQSDASCGTAVDDATIEYETGNESYYEVDGVYQTPNPCQKLSYEVDMDGNTVIVNLTNEAEEDTEICRQCVGQIEYSINVTAPGNESVEIYHEEELIIDESIEEDIVDQVEEENNDKGVMQRFFSFLGF